MVWREIIHDSLARGQEMAYSRGEEVDKVRIIAYLYSTTGYRFHWLGWLWHRMAGH